MIEPVWLATIWISDEVSEPTVTRFPVTSTEAVRSSALNTCRPSFSALSESSMVIGIPEMVTLVSVSELALIMNQIVKASKNDNISSTILCENNRVNKLLFLFMVLLLSVFEQYRKQIVFFAFTGDDKVGQLFVDGITVEVLDKLSADG